MSHRRLMIGVALSIAIFVATATAAIALPDIPADKFEPYTNCGCHSSFMETWSRSMHTKALDDPLYQLKLSEANKATDGALGPFCEGCHAPVAVMSGEIADRETMSPQSADGVGCDFCHQVTGTNDPLGNTSQIVTADGVKKAQFDDAVSPYHDTAYSAFHETAEFCGSCHNVDHPGNGLHLEATYTEWKNGPYAAEGTVCQDCHMTPGPGPNKPHPGTAAAGGPQRDHIYIMTFAGGNVALGDSVLAEERLKAAAEIEIEVPDVLEEGSSTDVQVTITNVGAGHYLPTGLTEVRQMWLGVIATDADGNEELLGRHEFGTILEDAEGNHPAELWDAAAFYSDDRIPPRESSTDTFQLAMAEDEAVTVSAALYYRTASEEMAEEAGVDIPTTTMASVSQVVYGSEGAKVAAPSGDDADSDENPIGLLVVGVSVLAIIGGGVWLVRRRQNA